MSREPRPTTGPVARANRSAAATLRNPSRRTGAVARSAADLCRQVDDAVRGRRLAGTGDRVLVALSGGPDSVALLHALWSLRNALGIKICAAHLNHRLRGRAGASDAAFARAFARRLGVRFIAGSADVPGLARQRKLSVETAARHARQCFLAAAARRLRCTAVATGHNRNDQAETVLMRLIRGTGLTGLAGIPRRNGMYIRPLLGVGRDEVLAYLRQNGLDFRLDASNDDNGMTRNRIRHELIPLLGKYNPRIIDTVARLADTVSEDVIALDRMTAKAAARCATDGKSQIIIDLDRFNGYNKGLRRNILRWIASRLSGDGAVPDFDQVEAALALIEGRTVGKRSELADGLWIEIGYREATVGRPPRCSGSEARVTRNVTRINVPGATRHHSVVFRARICRAAVSGQSTARDQSTAWFDWDELEERTLTTGTREPGERMIPFGARHPKKVTELMIEAKIPRKQRATWPVVRSAGTAIWIPGLRRSSAAPVTSATTRMLRLELSTDET